ncbi:hypothetical protein RRG08_051154 [Elysia crispata]|uniref:C-type lectin domain-containing protein n=1 Tax=Elysia crispata TaxID=231223 RepID=A0AAE0YN01_9GAST|nr:hypothetical protein RRG08_051154 [Elysia crispata]
MKLRQISVTLLIGCVIYFLSLAHECIADFSCPPGWKSTNSFSTACIKVFNSITNRDEARKTCQAYGGDLVRILDMTRRRFLADMLLPGVFYWTGHKYSSEGKLLKSIDDIEEKKTSLAEYDACVTLLIKVVDVPCRNQASSICEIPPVCESNTYGSNCSKRCSPHCGGANNSCDNRNGSCVYGCISGYHGDSCESACEDNTYGPDCLEKCSPNCGGANNSCDTINGSCLFGCLDGYRGALCDSVCENNTYGANCSKRCSPHCAGASCDNRNGSCANGCVDGYHGEFCASVCESNTYGSNCSKRCSPHCGGANNSCDNRNGSCVYGCISGYHGDSCESACEDNTYGPDCLEKCSPNCGGANNSCDTINGSCVFGCLDGYRGALCDSVCENNTYGENCSKPCSPNCASNNTCDKINGTCVFGCLYGYQGALCDIEIKSVTARSRNIIYTTTAIISSVVFFLVVLCACGAMVPMNRAMNQPWGSTGHNSQTEYEEQPFYYSFRYSYSDTIYN